MTPTIAQTEILMARLHANQVDQIGRPYKFHPLRVAANLCRVFASASDDAVRAALLHDTIEDCGETARSLLQKGYTRDCVAIVVLLSKPEDDMRDYARVIEDLALSGNRDAMMVKIADNMDNCHPERMAQLQQNNPAKAQRLVARYHASIVRLSAALGVDAAPILAAIKTAPSLAESEIEPHISLPAKKPLGPRR